MAKDSLYKFLDSWLPERLADKLTDCAYRIFEKIDKWRHPKQEVNLPPRQYGARETAEAVTELAKAYRSIVKREMMERELTQMVRVASDELAGVAEVAKAGMKNTSDYDFGSLQNKTLKTQGDNNG